MGDIDRNAINQIMEMGINEQDAIAALQATNGNVNEALNYIFTSQDSSSVNADYGALVPLDQTQPITEQDSVAIDSGIIDHVVSDNNIEEDPALYKRPPLLPKRPTDQSAHHIEDIDNRYGQQDVNRSQYASLSDSEYGSEEIPIPIPSSIEDASEGYSSYSVYDDINKYERPANSLPVLMPVACGIFESYLNPIITIFHEIPSLRAAVYHYHFSTLGFHPRWFRGETVMIPPETSIITKDKESYDLRFLLEIQRLFGFLDGDSNRSFTSVKNFLKSFPLKIKQEFSDIDNIREAYDIFYKTFAEQLEVSGVPNPLDFFENRVDDVEDNDIQTERVFGMFHIEADEMKHNLYKTLHSILWGEMDLNAQTISKLADIITVSFDPTFDDGYVPVGFELDEVFYPQIYSTEYKPIINEIAEKNNHLDREKRKISDQLMKTRAYNGKHIPGNLNSSIKFLRSEYEDSETKDPDMLKAIKELEKIEFDLNERRSQLLEKQIEIQREKSQTSIHNIDLILKLKAARDSDDPEEESHKASTEQKEPEPYILTGIVLKPSLFLFLKKTKDEESENYKYQWNYVEYDNAGLDFTVRELDFEEIKRAIHNFTSQHFDSSIVLTYVKKSTFDQDLKVVVPESVKEFLQKDKAELENILELLSSDTDTNTEESEVKETEHELIDFDSDSVSDSNMNVETENQDNEDKENREPSIHS